MAEVARDIHRLTDGVANFYVIEDGGRLTLVDAGAPKDWDLFVEAVASIGREPADLDAVLLTHAHADHTGFAERARADLDAPVHVHEADEETALTGRAPKNERGLGGYLWHAEAYRTLFVLLGRGASKIVPVAEASVFHDGEVLDVPGRPRVVHAPGHTPGSCSLLFEDRRAALVGDVLCTHNALTGRDGPQIMPGGLNVDSEQALRSLETVAEVPADVLLPGHGEPWRGSPREAVEAARAAGIS